MTDPFVTDVTIFALAVFVGWVHRSNVRRLIAGTENRFGAGEPEGPPPGSDAPETVESEA